MFYAFSILGTLASYGLKSQGLSSSNVSNLGWTVFRDFSPTDNSCGLGSLNKWVDWYIFYSNPVFGFLKFKILVEIFEEILVCFVISGLDRLRTMYFLMNGSSDLQCVMEQFLNVATE